MIAITRLSLHMNYTWRSFTVYGAPDEVGYELGRKSCLDMIEMATMRIEMLTVGVTSSFEFW